MWSHPDLSEPFTIYGNRCIKGNDHDSSESRMSRFTNLQMLQQVTLSGALNYLQVSFTFFQLNKISYINQHLEACFRNTDFCNLSAFDRPASPHTRYRGGHRQAC